MVAHCVSSVFCHISQPPKIVYLILYFHKVLDICFNTEGELKRLALLRESIQLAHLLKVTFKGKDDLTQFCITCWLHTKVFMTKFYSI